MKRTPDPIEQTIEGDLEALRSTTDQALPTLAETSRAVAMRRQDLTSKGAFTMTLRRPRVIGALATCALAAILAVIPLPYSKTVGHDVTLLFSAELPPVAIKGIARQLKRALAAESVQVRLENGQATLVAKSTNRSRLEVERVTSALVQRLADKKLDAKVSIAPRTERVSGTVYAMALDRIVQIRVDGTGKTDAQVAAEITEQLAEAGFDAWVDVKRKDGQTQISIDADDGDRQLKIERRTVGGPAQIEMQMGLDDKREPGMTDAQLKEKIERQLRARGLEPSVTVKGDEIRVEARKEVKKE